MPLGGMRWMWVVVMFDLPTTTKPDKQAYTRFRRDLINDGYIMLQWSIYARLVNGLERAEKHKARLRQMVPPRGNVRVMVVTESQYARMELMVGKRTDFEEKGATQLVLF